MTDSLLRDLQPGRIDYAALAAGAPARDQEAVHAYVAEELPYAWLDAYVLLMPHAHNVQRIDVAGYEYLWDLSSSLVNQGLVAASEAVDDRLVGAHGVSRRSTVPRGSRLKRRPLGPVDVVDRPVRSPYDRGHAIGHALGGVMDLNIIPQVMPVNRGGLWRRMERYCLENPGTYFFSRPLYAGLCGHPAEIDFGLLRTDGTLWVNTFKNYGSLDELERFERLYRERIGAPARPEGSS